MRALQQHTPRRRQRGMSFIGVVFMGFIIVVLAIVGSKAVPIVIENMNIKKAATKAARQGTTVPEVRLIYDRATEIDEMHSIRAKDLEISKDADNKIVVSYAYERDVPLYGPVYLVFRFNDSVK